MIPSPQQETIFSWFRGDDLELAQNLLIRARAGTGKTTTIIEACRFIKSPMRVRLFSFNTDIAEELAYKLINPREGQKPLSKSRFKAGTLNSIGESFLRARAIETGCMDRFAVDENGKRSKMIIGDLFREEGLPENDELQEALEGLVALLKVMMPYAGTGYRAQEEKLLLEIAADYDVMPPAAVMKHGFTAKRHADLAIKAIMKSAEFDGWHDFNDQIFLPVRHGWAKAWYDVVIVDEAQDMNFAQLELAQKVCKEGGRIVLVGDDRQAIYGFRGADAGALDRLKGILNADEMPLTVTYRCPRSVVALAQQFVKDLAAHENAPEGVVETIDATHIVARAQLGDFVLSRVNAPLAKLAYGFIRAHKRVRVLGRTDLGRSLVKLVERVSRRKDGGDLETKIENWRRDELYSIEGDDRKAQRQRQLVEDKAETLLFLAGEEKGDAASIVRRLNALFEGDVKTARAADYVTLSTVHKIKGKEADNVFVLEGTLFLENGDQAEEENIAYVAYTRAKKALYLCTGRP